MPKKPKPEIVEWITFEDGTKWLPAAKLRDKLKNPPLTAEDLYRDSTVRMGLEGFPIPEDLSSYQRDLDKLLESYNLETTDIWWYNDLWMLSGSAGYAVIKKSYPMKILSYCVVVMA